MGVQSTIHFWHALFLGFCWTAQSCYSSTGRKPSTAHQTAQGPTVLNSGTKCSSRRLGWVVGHCEAHQEQQPAAFQSSRGGSTCLAPTRASRWSAERVPERPCGRSLSMGLCGWSPQMVSEVPPGRGCNRLRSALARGAEVSGASSEPKGSPEPPPGGPPPERPRSWETGRPGCWWSPGRHFRSKGGLAQVWGPFVHSDQRLPSEQPPRHATQRCCAPVCS